MASAFSINSELENRHTDTMIVEVTRHLGTVPFVSIKIPPGEVRDLCYRDLHIEANPERPALASVSVEGGAEAEKKFIFSTLIRDNAKLVLNFENGKITVLALEGNILARIGCIVKLRRILAGIGEHTGKKLYNKQP